MSPSLFKRVFAYAAVKRFDDPKWKRRFYAMLYGGCSLIQLNKLK